MTVRFVLTHLIVRARASWPLTRRASRDGGHDGELLGTSDPRRSPPR